MCSPGLAGLQVPGTSGWHRVLSVSQKERVSVQTRRINILVLSVQPCSVKREVQMQDPGALPR